MGRFAPAFALFAVVCGCRTAPADAPASDDDGGADSAGTSTATESGGSGTTFAPAEACEASTECAGDAAHCVAPYDSGTHRIGDAQCVSTCVEAGDLARACVDDASCCAGLRCNPVDGFCAAEPAGTSTGSSTGTSSSGGSDSGSSSTGATDASDSSSTSSTG